MQRREFLMHSGVLLAVAVIGVPVFGFEDHGESRPAERYDNHYRLHGHKRDGCALAPGDIGNLRNLLPVN